MARTYMISVACDDRTGLVAAITGRLFDLGGDLGDTTFAVLGTAAEFTSLVDLPDHLTAEEIRSELAVLAETAGARIEVSPYDRPAAHGPLGHVSHIVTLSGGDQPGLVARIAEVFGEFGANIVHMEAGREPGPGAARYATRFAVAIPAGAVAKCRATIANTAEALNLSWHWNEVDLEH